MQIFPGKSQLHFFLDAYKEATSDSYGTELVILIKFYKTCILGYLLVYLHPTTDPSLRLRSKIFPDDKGAIVYQPIVT